MQKISVGEGISFCRLSTRSRYRNRLARFFSSEESTSKIESTAEIPSDNHQSQKIIFPWRHEDTLLPRLVEGTIDHATKGQLLTTVTTQTGHVQMNALASAFMFLDVPLYQFPFFGTWKGELADSVSWAFAQGVAGLLSNLIPQTGTFYSIVVVLDVLAGK